MRLILTTGDYEVCLYPFGADQPEVAMMVYPYLLDPGTTVEDADYRDGGAVPSHRVTLQNQDGQLIELLRIPPRRARLEDDDAMELFSGTVGRITVADTADLELVA